MVVGCVSGKWLAIDSETRELYTHHTDGSEPIQVSFFGKLRNTFMKEFIDKHIPLFLKRWSHSPQVEIFLRLVHEIIIFMFIK